MDDLFDNLMDALGRNRRNLIIAIIAYIVITLIILVIIWWPKEKDYLKYESINMEDKQQELAQNYINDISIWFKIGEKEAIKEMISDEYVEYSGESKEEIIKELDDAGFFNLYSEVRGVDLYIDENTYVYTTTINYKNNSRDINIIETYPYKYKITFDDFYKYNVVNKSTINQGINFTVKDIYRNLKYIEINMTIENMNSSYIRLDFNSPTCVQAVLDDGKKYSLSNLVSTSDYTDVDVNTIITKNFVFEIPAQLQNHIEYIIFNGVILEFSTANIKVEI